MSGNFLRFFEAGDACFLIESIYVYSYSDLRCISIRNNKNVTVLFDSPDLLECYKSSLNMLTSAVEFGQYVDSFNSFLKSAYQEIQDIVAQKNSQEFVKIFLKFLSYYRWTESFYTDKVYALTKKSITLKNNLLALESLKTEGRDFLNSITNGRSSALHQLILSCSDDKMCDRSVDELLGNAHPFIPPLRYSNHLLTCEHQLVDSNSNLFVSVNEWLHKYDYDCSIKGVGASKGIVCGEVFVLSSNFDTYDMLERILREVPEGIILVSETTSPDIISACYKAKGIITNQGGLGSHAAIISRELGIPCVVGTNNATHLFNNGDFVCINGLTGEVHRVSKA